MWNSFLCLHGAKAEAGTLPNDAVLVREQLDELVYDTLVYSASASQGDGSHSSDVGITIRKECNEGLNHSRTSKFGWGGGNELRVNYSRNGLFLHRINTQGLYI